jgi:DNA polymerase III alpha subunit
VGSVFHRSSIFGVAMVIAASVAGARAEPLALAPAGGFLASPFSRMLREPALRGASHGEELVLRAREIGLVGLGVADRNSVAGVVRAHQAAKEAGLPFAPGARLVFCDGTPDTLAYPESRAGWGRLTQLLTLGKRRAGKSECLLRRDDLLAHAAGLNLVVMPGRLKRAAAAEAESLPALLAALREAAAAHLARRQHVLSRR